jgi:hypothetical protein
MRSRTAHAHGVCSPLNVSAPRTWTERSRRPLSRDAVSGRITVARPGKAYRLPANLPFLEQGEVGGPSERGGAGRGSPFSSLLT